jgi:hypothetical protein
MKERTARLRVSLYSVGWRGSVRLVVEVPKFSCLKKTIGNIDQETKRIESPMRLLALYLGSIL